MKSVKIELDDYMMSILGILAGLLLVIFPQQSVDVVTYAIGAISLVYGVMRLVSFFRNRSVSFLFVGDLILGIVLLGIGIFSFTNPGGIFAFLPIVLGIIVLIEGISKIQRAWMLKRNFYQRWQAAMLIGIAIAALGVVLIFNPFGALVVTVRILGVILIIDGITGLWVGHALRGSSF